MGSAGEALHIGATPWRLGGDGGERAILDQAEQAERLGFESFWLPESHFAGATAMPAPLLVLAAVAARTRHIALGTTSFLLPLRHPLHVAAEVAVLDRLSGGRLILGVGRGFRSALFAAFEVPAAEKRDRFEAALLAMRRAWSGEPVAWDDSGSAAPARPVHLAPRPVQKPHPPLWVAAFGPKAIDQAGRLGLPYLASPIESLEQLEENHARHRQALPDGVAADLAVPVMRTVFASRDPSVLERARAALERQAAGLASAPAASLRRASRARVDDWALLGTPEQVTRGILGYRERIGMTHLIARLHVPGLAPDALDASLRLLAELGTALR